MNQVPVPAVKQGECFRYLGRFYDFVMSNQVHRNKLCSLFSELLKEIDSSPLHPRNKLLLHSTYACSSVSWYFTVADLFNTWVTENLDNLAFKYVRQRLDLSISATLSSTMLSKSQFGWNLVFPSDKSAQCHTISRTTLKSSNDEIISLGLTPVVA